MRFRKPIGAVVDRAAWLRYGPFHAQIVVTRRCNLECAYCTEFDRDSPPIATEILRQRVAKLRQLGVLAVEFTGGEPLLHPDLAALVSFATSQGFVQRKLISNAFLMTPAIIEDLNRARLTHCQISVDGALPNATTVKVLRPLRPKLAQLRDHARFRVTLSAVVGAAPPEEVREVMPAAVEYGFRPRVLLIHDGRGQLCLSEENRALYDEIERALGRQRRQAHDYRSRLAHGGEAPFKCRAGSRYLYVDEKGMVRWCSQTREAWGRPLEDYGSADLREQFLTPKACSTHCTVGCVRNSSKLDEWRAQRCSSARRRSDPAGGGTVR